MPVDDAVKYWRCHAAGSTSLQDMRRQRRALLAELKELLHPSMAAQLAQALLHSGEQSPAAWESGLHASTPCDEEMTRSRARALMAGAYWASSGAAVACLLQLCVVACV